MSRRWPKTRRQPDRPPLETYPPEAQPEIERLRAKEDHLDQFTAKEHRTWMRARMDEKEASDLGITVAQVGLRRAMANLRTMRVKKGYEAGA